MKSFYVLASADGVGRAREDLVCVVCSCQARLFVVVGPGLG